MIDSERVTTAAQRVPGAARCRLDLSIPTSRMSFVATPASAATLSVAASVTFRMTPALPPQCAAKLVARPKSVTQLSLSLKAWIVVFAVIGVTSTAKNGRVAAYYMIARESQNVFNVARCYSCHS